MKKKEKGFTLAELLGVIIVLGIVLGITVVAYINLKSQTDATYYKSLEESLKISGTDYFHYNKDNAPNIFGEQSKVTLRYLKDNNYVEKDVLSSEGDDCNLDDSYIGAYKNSSDETKYYVCLVCGEYKTNEEFCNNEVDYSLSVHGKVAETDEVYNLDGSKWANKDVVLTFETVNDVKEVEVKGNNISKKCTMTKQGEFNTCQIKVDTSGTYSYYGKNGETKTEEKEVKVKIDKTPPTFDIEKIGNNNKIEIETSSLKATINNAVKNIADKESDIKAIEYSLEEKKDYYNGVNKSNSFQINKEVNIGKYNLKIRVSNNANLVTVKTLEYDVYKRTGELTNQLCNNVIYNGNTQTLAVPDEGFTLSNNTGLDAKNYNITATLEYGYRWSDNTTGVKTITCSIGKKNVDVSWSGGTTFVYNGNLQGPTGSVVSGVSGETLNITNTKEINAGKYTSIATITSVRGGQGKKENYNLVRASQGYEIQKATPTLTLSQSSGSVNASSSITFTERANIRGKFTNVSSVTGVATVSPATTAEVNANTAQTVTIRGVNNGTSIITVTFTPSDTNNYNKKTATYNVTGYKVASEARCTTPTYTGSAQVIASGGVGITLSGQSRTNAGTYEVTETLQNGYRWSDGSTGTKKLSCGISKATPTLTLSPTSGNVNASSSTTFTERANIRGKFSNVSSATGVATVSPATTAEVNANTAQTVTVRGVSNGSAIITVTFTPSDTTNYNNRTATYNATGYKVASEARCTSPTYTGSAQTIASGGVGITLSGQSQTNVGTYQVTETLQNGYRWSDGSTASKRLSCGISKATPTLTLSPSNGNVNVGANVTFTGTASVSGTFSVSSQATNIATAKASPTTGTRTTVTVQGVAKGNTNIIVSFTPSNSNYTATSKSYSIMVNNKTALPGNCIGGLKYTGSPQDIISGGVGVSYTSSSSATISGITVKGTNSGNYSITVKPLAGYTFSDGMSSKTLNCTISKATPILTLSQTSGVVTPSSSATFTEKANVKGKFKNVSGTPGVATVSPATTSDVNANIAQTVTVRGVSNGSSIITVTFTPSDTTNYNTTTATYTAAAYKVASEAKCTTPTYTGSSQTIASGGVGITLSGQSRINAGTYDVIETLQNGYRWSDGSTPTRKLSCKISKATPILTLSATSGVVTPSSSTTFTEKANVKGKFKNVSGTPGVATVSPATTSEVNANVTQTVTVRGVSNGSSIITVTFTPSDTTNYNNKTATYTAAGYKVASEAKCTTPTYTGSTQTIASGGVGITLSGQSRINAGTYDVTETLQNGYRWSDGSTTTKKLSCKISKATPTLTLSQTSGTVNVGKTVSFTGSISPSISGTYSANSSDLKKATVSISGNKITVTGVAIGTSRITVSFKPNDTVNYNNASDKTYSIQVKGVEYAVLFQTMMQDGRDYTTVASYPSDYLTKGTKAVADDGTYLKNLITLPTYRNMKAPDISNLKIVSGANNIFTIQYTRTCFGTTCDYCEKGSKLGECLYSNRTNLNLWSSGLSVDNTNQTVRYTGTTTKQPKNYICFGTNSLDQCYKQAGSVYRIVGVFKTEHQVRIIKTTKESNTYWFDKTDRSDIRYSISNLKTNVNGKIDSLFNGSIYGMGTTKYKDILSQFGLCSASAGHGGTPESYLKKEWDTSCIGRDGKTVRYTTVSVSPTWLSDLILSTGELSEVVNKVKTTSWMFGGEEWLFLFWNSAFANYIEGSTGRICNNNTVDNGSKCTESASGYYDKIRTKPYRLTAHLNKNVLYCNGDGSKEKPYIIGYGSCSN